MPWTYEYRDKPRPCYRIQDGSDDGDVAEAWDEDVALSIVHTMNGTWPCTMCGAAHPKGRSHSQCTCRHLRCEAGTRRCLDCGVHVSKTSGAADTAAGQQRPQTPPRRPVDPGEAGPFGDSVVASPAPPLRPMGQEENEI